MNSVYLISGPISSGKGVASECLREMYKNNVKIFILSDLLREMLRQKNIPITRDSLAGLSMELKEKHGRGILGEMVLKEINSSCSEGEIVIIDSIRDKAEVEKIKEIHREAILLFIESPLEVRLERAMRRARIDDMSMEDLEDSLKKELERYDLESIRKISDIVIDGSVNRELMMEKVREKIGSYINKINNKELNKGLNEKLR